MSRKTETPAPELHPLPMSGGAFVIENGVLRPDTSLAETAPETLAPATPAPTPSTEA